MAHAKRGKRGRGSKGHGRRRQKERNDWERKLHRALKVMSEKEMNHRKNTDADEFFVLQGVWMIAI